MLDALLKQMGEADWLRLTEKERQQKLIELKKRARELQREGSENVPVFLTDRPVMVQKKTKIDVWENVFMYVHCL